MSARCLQWAQKKSESKGEINDEELRAFKPTGAFIARPCADRRDLSRGYGAVMAKALTV
jgi:hypothetical protein